MNADELQGRWGQFTERFKQQSGEKKDELMKGTDQRQQQLGP